MLRCIVIREFESFFNALNFDDKTLRNGLPEDVNAGKSISLSIDFFFDLGDVFVSEVDSDENDLGVNTMLGLREEICSDEGGICCVVCDNLE